MLYVYININDDIKFSQWTIVASEIKKERKTKQKYDQI